MLVTDIFASYCEQLGNDHAKTTYHTYTSNLRAFLRWMGPSALVSDLTTPTIRRFVVECSDKSQRPRSVRTKLYAIRSLCKFLTDQGYFAANPASSVLPPKLDPARRDVPTTEAVVALLSACERVADPYKATLAAAVVSILAHSGLRRSELLALHVKDVNLEDGSLFVRAGKRDKSAHVFPNEQCLKAVRAYLELRKARQMEARHCSHPYLFALDKSRRFGHVSLRKMLQELAAIAGHKGDKGLLPHGLRHNYATRLYQSPGVNLEDVKSALRHASIVTTAIYLHCSDLRLKEIAKFSALPLTASAEAPPEPAIPPATAPPENVRPARSRRIAVGIGKQRRKD